MSANTSVSNAVVKADSVWMDGALMPWAEANVHVMTHALHYGLGVFEGIRAYKTKDGRLAIFRLQEHIRRFMDSAHIIMMKLPFSEQQLTDACLDVLRSQADKFPNGAYLRPIAFMGDGAMGLGAINPTRVAICPWEWGSYLGDKGMKEGIRAKVSSFTRMHVNVNMVRGKISGQYVNSILAKREAVLGGYDEAILLDISGFVAEASGENVFCVGRHGAVRTPSLSSPILRGITRDTVIELRPICLIRDLVGRVADVGTKPVETAGLRVEEAVPRVRGCAIPDRVLDHQVRAQLRIRRPSEQLVDRNGPGGCVEADLRELHLHQVRDLLIDRVLSRVSDRDLPTACGQLRHEVLQELGGCRSGCTYPFHLAVSPLGRASSPASRCPGRPDPRSTYGRWRWPAPHGSWHRRRARHPC